MPKQDKRSAEALAYRKLYKTARWLRLRDAKLAQDPLCQWCLEREIVEPATEVHHADGGHKGDVDKFWNGPFISTCKQCHASRGQREDRGTHIEFGVDGWPVGVPPKSRPARPRTGVGTKALNAAGFQKVFQ